MSLLPPRFQEPLSSMPLGPVVKPEAKPFEPHVHDWRPSASSKDHVVCSCGQVSLREFVMPPEAKLTDDGQDVDWAGWGAAPKVTHSDSALEVLKRREQAEENERRRRQAIASRFAVDLAKAIR